ncbi:MAG: ABC transporter ATP-binding protein [Faecalicoccus sp.]|uniref:ABC transporter ATP-binding protein n=1 Tax=Faecalicoccus sp. TaxID=1971758 RepID=UPI002A7ED789|nr:ABC transporter ATP-binding protein [Faecalicoccus sp.]MDY4279385.1 ABC transporter ATP-binding protein [Faecalicoccus sp.]
MLKTLMAQIKEYKINTIKSPLYVIIEVIMEVLIPFLMSILVDQGIEQGNMDIVWKIGGTMVVCAFIGLWAGAQSGKHAAIASSGFAKNLRKAEYENIQKFAFSNIDQYSTGGLITRMMTDVTNVQMAFQMVIRVCVRAPFMLVAALGMCFFINFELSLVFVGVIIFLGIALFAVSFVVHPVFEKMFRKYDALNASVQENISGIRVVKAYVRSKYETQKFHKESGDIYHIQMKAEKILIWNMPLMQMSMYGAILMISWFGAHMIVGSSLTTGELMSLFTYTANILMSLMMFSMVFVMVVMSIASGERIAQVINQKSDLVSPENGIKEIKNGQIDFEDVYFEYTNIQDEANYVLDNIDLHIPSGSTLGILGATGSAKSSLVQLIPRLYDVTGGSVKVAGIDVRDYDLESLRNSVAMVLQKNVLFSGTIKENMRWGNPNATDEEIEEACKLAQADEFIQKMPDKYDTYIEQGGTNVSGGQRQRLCIARAILKKPKILILDDSTSAVDTKTDALIRQAFMEKIPDTTRIIISQRVSSIQDSDQILVLDEGHISGLGTHEELLKTNKLYRETFQEQQKGGSLNE